jgi:hypothetical protein
LAEEVKDRGGRLHLSGERRNPRFENFQPQLSRSPMNLRKGQASKVYPHHWDRGFSTRMPMNLRKGQASKVYFFLHSWACEL